MPQKFKKTYHVESVRLSGYDYAKAGAYFITICTKDRVRYFGEIRNQLLHASEIGKILVEEWLNTPRVRPDMNLILDEYVVMPDHFHCILVIGLNAHNQAEQEQPYSNQRSSQSKNLASIMRGFKSAVTCRARKIRPNFAWQPGFYEHIIRDNRALENIRNYIINNPQKGPITPP
jgi:REP element-mobilizing transposase RayT